MVACKNSPGQNKKYQKQDYRLSASITGLQYNPSYSRPVPVDNDGIEKIIQPTTGNELYQKRIEPFSVANEYDLLQPLWFDEIMRRLAKDNAGKTKPGKSLYSRCYYSLN